MADFKYQDMFPMTEDTTEYRLLSEDHVSTVAFDGTEVLKVSAEGLTFLAEQAFKDVSLGLDGRALCQVRDAPAARGRMGQHRRRHDLLLRTGGREACGR